MSIAVQEQLAAEALPEATSSQARRRYFEIQTPIPRTATVLLGSASVAIFFGAWQLADALHLINEVLLPPPTKVLSSLIDLFASTDYLHDIGTSLYRISASFAAASLVAMPLGLLMGSFAIVAAALNPLVSAARYLPAPSFIPVLLMLLGATDAEKLALLFIGVVWFLITMIMDVTQSVPRELIDTARTLGAGRRQILSTVIIPASLPGIVTAMRQMLAVSWTYLVIAEIVAADGGIGAMMMRAQRYVHIDLVMAGIVTIGVLGVVSDMLVRAAHRLAFSYLYLGERER
ncbi:MAG: ABC transporter permease [Methyloceanibacter sp.]